MERCAASCFQNQIWGGIVAGDSLEYLTSLDAIVDWIEERPRARRPNAYVDIHKVLIQYVSGMSPGSPPTMRGSDPVVAQGLGGQPCDHPWGVEPTLALFAVELLNFLRVSPLIQFDAYGYFNRTALPMDQPFAFPEDFDSTGS
jgi:hypothetical protein